MLEQQLASQQLDMRMALNAQILNVGHTDTVGAGASGPELGSGIIKAKSGSVANKSSTEWNSGVQEFWPKHLPRPPSLKKLVEDEEEIARQASNKPGVIVFNANTQEGFSMTRVLSQKGMRVNAVVRVVTSRNAKKLAKLKGVTVKVADLNDIDAVMEAASGCQQAFLVTKYWERFENPIEEQMAKVVLTASSQVGIKRLVLATFEDTLELRLRGRKSQISPTVDGMIYPQFEGMKNIETMAKGLNISLTHMMTSYLDEPGAKKSLILIRNENGKIISQPYIQETK